MQLGREAHLGVDHAVGGEVLGALRGHALDGVARLHDADGVVERLEVAARGRAVGALGGTSGQLVGIGRRQPVVADLVGQLDDRRRAQAAVEVVVQEHLRGPRIASSHGRSLIPRGYRPLSTSGRAGWAWVRCRAMTTGRLYHIGFGRADLPDGTTIALLSGIRAAAS